MDGYPGVTRVRGSNRMQTAYRIDSSANLKMSTMRVFDQGLPEQFGKYEFRDKIKKLNCFTIFFASNCPNELLLIIVLTCLPKFLYQTSETIFQ